MYVFKCNIVRYLNYRLDNSFCSSLVKTMHNDLSVIMDFMSRKSQ